MSRGIEVSVVIPCLNAERTIGTCVRKAMKAIADLNVRGEVIVVDNNSEDGSARIAQDGGAKVILWPQRGYGAACTRGFREAKGHFIIMGDDDDTYDFLEIPRFLRPLQNRECDLVLGTRLRGNIAPGAMSPVHKAGNRMLTSIFRLLFHLDISDLTSGYRAFNRAFLDQVELKTTGMEFSTEMLIRAAHSGVRVRTVPISYAPAGGTRSRLRPLPDGCRILRLLLWAASTNRSVKKRSAP